MAAATAGALIAAGGWAGAAGAAPGVPQAPTPVFSEAFENVTTLNAQNLADYTGPPPLAMEYTADATWLNGAACNGVITSYNRNPGGTGCPQSVFDTWARALASAMGEVRGGGNDNDVLVHTTISGFPAAPTPAASLETTKPIPLTAPQRFITFGLDVAVTACHAAHPKLRFFLLDGSEVISTNDDPIDPCDLPGGTNVDPPGPLTTARVGRFTSDKAILMLSPQVGMRMTNDQRSGSGNDYAVDNIQMLDATPSLDKAFVPDTIATHETSTLTFTITNTSELGEKAGWSFTDALTDGLTLVGGWSSTCGPGTMVDAEAGSAEITVSGDLHRAVASCTVSVPVRAASAGAYPNGPHEVSTAGLNEPGKATLTVLPTVSIGDVTVTEGDTGLSPATPAALHLTLDGPSTEPATVGYTTADGTALSGADYVTKKGTVTFAPGETSKVVTFDVNGDLIDEPAETFEALLSDASGARIADGSGEVTILDDDRNGTFSCRASALRVGGDEPLIGVANPPGDPCRDDSHGLLRVNATGPMTSAHAMSLEQRTNLTPDDQTSDPQAGDNADAQSRIQDAVIKVGTTTITVSSAFARATATCAGDGQPPRFSSEGATAQVLVNGVLRANVRSSYFAVPVPGGTLHLNHTTQGQNFRTQRAVWFQSSTPLLPDVVVGEATADYHGNPCTN